MNSEFILNKKDGKKVKSVIKLLDISYLDNILALQQYIYDLIENKDFSVSYTHLQNLWKLQQIYI